MTNNERQEVTHDSTTAGPNLLNEAIRFLRLVRRKLPTLIACMVIGSVAGTVWYVTATRKYESSSEIMVLKTEGNVMDGNNSSNQRTIQDMMATYQKVITSDKVLEGAISRLVKKEHRIDLKGIPKARWIPELKKNLTVSSARQTTLLSVRYVSKDPKTAAFVVNAVVESYLDMMRGIHSGDSKESIDLLSKEEKRVDATLQEKERELLSLKQGSGILLQGDDRSTHVVIQQTIKLNDALIEAQSKTVAARALAMSVQKALETGTDIQSYVQQIAGDLSRDFVLREMGIGSNDAMTVAKREDELLTDQTELQNRLKTYGPNHPQIRQLEGRIAKTEKWLAERAQVVSSAMDDLRKRELGPRLLGMVQQRLYQATAHEAAIREEFESIKTEAISLNGQMAQIEILEANLKRLRAYYDEILEKIAKVDIGANSGLKISLTSPARVSLAQSPPRSQRQLCCVRSWRFCRVGADLCRGCTRRSFPVARRTAMAVGPADARHDPRNGTIARHGPRYDCDLLQVGQPGIRIVPHIAQLDYVHRVGYSSAGGDKYGTWRRQNDDAGESCRRIRSIEKANTADRCRSSSTGDDAVA